MLDKRIHTLRSLIFRGSLCRISTFRGGKHNKWNWRNFLLVHERYTSILYAIIPASLTPQPFRCAPICRANVTQSRPLVKVSRFDHLLHDTFILPILVHGRFTLDGSVLHCEYPDEEGLREPRTLFTHRDLRDSSIDSRLLADDTQSFCVLVFKSLWCLC